MSKDEDTEVDDDDHEVNIGVPNWEENHYYKGVKVGRKMVITYKKVETKLKVNAFVGVEEIPYPPTDVIYFSI